jgi:hypothetical protein
MTQLKSKRISAWVYPAMASMVLGVAACGGGGGGSPPANPPGQPPVASCSTDRAVIEAPSSATAQRNVELALRSCSGPLRSFEWTQTAGPSLGTLLGRRSAAINVEPQQAGSYGFEVRYTDETGTSRVANSVVNVAAAASTPAVVVRGDPSVWGHSTLSARVWLPSLTSTEAANARITWTQTSGPSLTLSAPNDAVQIIQAPVVQADAVAELQASVQLADGRTLMGGFRILVQPPPAYPATNQALWNTSRPISPVYAYRAASPWASALERCVYAASLVYNQTCLLRELPLLGTQFAGQVPTVEQVMDRVLVSHDWMGEVFEQYLRTQDPTGELRRQLASTTAVVIGSRVRPAFYWVATGAIYLDAANLWLTPAQRDTLSEAPDPRSAFGADLAHTSLWRFVRNNQSATVNPALSLRQSRGVADLTGSLTRLMYHELTHAADFTPPSRHTVMNPDGPVSQSARSWGSEALQTIPLRSSELAGLARVRFYGDASTTAQRGYSPEQVGAFFQADVATDFYSYSASVGSYSVEDTAMLLEEALMQVRYGILRDVAVTSPILAGQTASDVIVRWGERGRVGQAAIRPRVQIAANNLMPWLGSNFAAGLAAPTPMRVGTSWQANLNPVAVGFANEKPLQAPTHADLLANLHTGGFGAGAAHPMHSERVAHLQHLQEQHELVRRMQRK